ncbi:hypothetical protein P0Y35_13655 [Kiritimatiellaeota bacterium B1221]|nr:hypothetical protein [Kiritimatiellaeota bacterium B1221]
MKKFLFVVLMLLCVVVAIVFVFLQKLDGIVQNQIEVIGTETLGEQVTVGDVKIELKNGMGEIRGLEIANPEGFSDVNAFEMERIRLAIGVASISRNPLVLNEFVLEAPVVSLEIREDGSSNLDEILAHLREQKKSDPEPPKPEADEKAEEDEKAPMFFVVNRLKIAGVQLTLRHPKLGEAPKELVLPDIDLQNVGGTEGVSAAGLGIVVVEEIAKSGAKAALKAEAEKQAGKLLDKAGSSLMKRLNSEE